MENNRKLSASGIVIKDDGVLLVKHTYGAAKGKYLIPGGFSENGELPQQTAEREVLEETGVHVRVEELVAVRFTQEEVWCIFNAVYLSGIPVSDGEENDEVVFMPIEQLLVSDEVVDTTKELVRAVICDDKVKLRKSDFVNKKFSTDTWQLFV